MRRIKPEFNQKKDWDIDLTPTYKLQNTSPIHKEKLTLIANMVCGSILSARERMCQ